MPLIPWQHDPIIVDAVSRVVSGARELAALPPPGSGPLKDDVGFSAATNAPMRAYLADVDRHGMEALPLEAHEMAARALAIHKNTQLAGLEIEEAQRIMRRALGGEAPKGAGAYKYEKRDEFKDPTDGRFTLDHDRKLIRFLPEYRPKAPFIRLVGHIPGAAGFKNAEGYTVTVPMVHVDKMIDSLGSYFPKFVRALKDRRDLILASAGAATRADDDEDDDDPVGISGGGSAGGSTRSGSTGSGSGSGGGSASERPSGPDRPAAGADPSTGANTPQQGKDATAELAWSWDGGPEVELRLPPLPPTFGSALLRRRVAWAPSTSPGVRRYALNTIEPLPDLLVEFGYPRAGAILRKLIPHWRYTGPSADKIEAAIIMYRRLRGRLPSQVREATDAELDAGQTPTLILQLAEVMDKVEPGDRSADLGAFGSFQLDQRHLLVMPPTSVRSVDVARAMPRDVSNGALRDYGWQISVVPKRLPIFIDIMTQRFPETLMLGLALRIAFLVNQTSEDERCEPLRKLSSLHDLSEVKDPAALKLIAKVQRDVKLAPGKAMHPYQTIGVAFLEGTGGRGWIADGTGLGKTLQTLAWLTIDPAERTPALVVCPLSVVSEWPRKAEQFTPSLDVRSLDYDHSPRVGQVDVVNYDILSRQADQIRARGYKTIVFDESHKIKDPTTKRAQASRDIALDIPHVILLSATPFPNKLPDIWMQLHLLDPLNFPSKRKFEQKYDRNSTGYTVTQGDDELVFDVPRTREELIEELQDELRCLMVRRQSTDVFKDLPPVQREIIPLTLTPEAWATFQRVVASLPELAAASWRRRKAAQAAKMVKAMLREEGEPGVSGAESIAKRAIRRMNAKGSPPDGMITAVEREFVRQAVMIAAPLINQEEQKLSAAEISQLAIFVLGALRQATGRVKIPQIVAWITDWLEANPEESLMVAAHHKDVVQAIAQACAAAKVPAVVVTGATSDAERKAAFSAFQSKRYRVIIVSGMAVQEGVDLDAARHLIFAERFWTPKDEEQLEGRIRRPASGSKAQAVVYYLEGQAPNYKGLPANKDRRKMGILERVKHGQTTDQRIGEIVAEKRQIITEIIGADRADTGSGTRITGSVDQQLAGDLEAAITHALASTDQYITPVMVWRAYWAVGGVVSAADVALGGDADETTDDDADEIGEAADDPEEEEEYKHGGGFMGAHK